MAPVRTKTIARGGGAGGGKERNGADGTSAACKAPPGTEPPGGKIAKQRGQCGLKPPKGRKHPPGWGVMDAGEETKWEGGRTQAAARPAEAAGPDRRRDAAGAGDSHCA